MSMKEEEIPKTWTFSNDLTTSITRSVTIFTSKNGYHQIQIILAKEIEITWLTSPSPSPWWAASPKDRIAEALNVKLNCEERIAIWIGALETCKPLEVTERRDKRAKRENDRFMMRLLLLVWRCCAALLLTTQLQTIDASVNLQPTQKTEKYFDSWFGETTIPDHCIVLNFGHSVVPDTVRKKNDSLPQKMQESTCGSHFTTLRSSNNSETWY